MTTSRRRLTYQVVGLSVFVLILLTFVIGCDKDDSSPTSTTPTTTSPSVAGNWRGSAVLDQGVSGKINYVLDAYFTQVADSFGGNWLWTASNPTYDQSNYFKGKITQARALTIQDTLSIWRGGGGGGGLKGTYTGVLTSDGDSISGSYTTSPLAATGTFVLVKK